MGWIAGVAPSEDENVPTLEFQIGSPFGYLPVRLEQDPRYDIRQITVEGEAAYLHLAAPHAINDGPQVGIYYERIPGSPDGKRAPSLRIEGDSRGFIDQELLARVLMSVRYAEIPELPDLPEPDVVPGEDWERMPAHSRFHSFTIKMPPGWQTTDLQGIDTLVGIISGDRITLTYDFGGFAGVPYEPMSRVREHRDDVPHMGWEERIGDKTLWFVNPVSPDPNPPGVTGVFASFDTGRGIASLSVSTSGLSGDQQEMVLAMLRTIELEAETQTPR